MASVNMAILIGHLGRDAESRATQSGQTVTNLSVATSKKWKDKATGEQKERTEWHKVTIWGVMAEWARDCRKGDRVSVIGELQTREYTDQSGTTRYTTEIVVQGHEGKFINNGRRDNGGSQAPAGRSGSPAPDFDDEIPW